MPWDLSRSLNLRQKSPGFREVPFFLDFWVTQLAEIISLHWDPSAPWTFPGAVQSEARCWKTASQALRTGRGLGCCRQTCQILASISLVISASSHHILPLWHLVWVAWCRFRITLWACILASSANHSFAVCRSSVGPFLIPSLLPSLSLPSSIPPFFLAFPSLLGIKPSTLTLSCIPAVL